MDTNKKKLLIIILLLIVILIVLLSVFLVIKNKKEEVTSSGNLEENLLEEIILDKTNIKLDLSGVYEDKIEATIENQQEENPEITWESSDEEIVKVNFQGEITGLKEGNAIITAKYKNFEARCQVIVISSTISEVLSEEITEMEVDLSYTNTINLTLNKDIIDLEGKTITWTSSDENIAKVNSKGSITALNNGEVVIKGECGEKVIICNLKVTTSVVNVELNKTAINLTIPNKTSEKLTAIVYPETAENKEINWSSSNEKVAVVEQNGKITAVNAGKAVITANCSGIIAECKVVVNKQSTNNSNNSSTNNSNSNSNNSSNNNSSNNIVNIQKLTINQSSIQLDMSKTSRYELKATIEPSNTTDKQVTWSSSNSNVVAVSNGVVTAKNNGEATITAKCGDKTATCKITVITSPTSITLDKSQTTINKGTTAKLTATVNPTTTTNKTITWSTSNSNIATVSGGTITAKNNGEATITAKCGDKTATCKVTVVTPVIQVSNITLNKSAIALNIGSTFKLTSTITPSNATDKTVTWSTNNSSVVTVSNGTVTAKGVGEATITAKSGSKTATCYVRVIPKKGIYKENYGGSYIGKYYMYIPDASNLGDPRQLPLVVFLHGSGEVGATQFEYLPKRSNLIGVLYENQNTVNDNYKGIIIAPNLKSGSSWTSQSLDQVYSLITALKNKYKISDRKISITGQSLGATGAWNMAIRYPNLFSCIVPVANCNNYVSALPSSHPVCWCIVGSKDSYALAPTKRMYNIIGGNNKDLTIIDGSTHDNIGYNAYKWSQYSNLLGYRVSIVNWMMDQSR